MKIVRSLDELSNIEDVVDKEKAAIYGESTVIKDRMNLYYYTFHKPEEAIGFWIGVNDIEEINYIPVFWFQEDEE